MIRGGMERLSYAHGAQPVPLLGETIGARLERAAAEHGERPALVSRHQRRLTYRELNPDVDRLARAASRSGSPTQRAAARFRAASRASSRPAATA